jgi:hypothetical protein
MHNVGKKEGGTAVAHFSEKLRRNGGYTRRHEDYRDVHKIYTPWSGQEDLLHEFGGFNGDDRVCVGEEHADAICVMRYETWTIPKACSSRSALRRLRPNCLKGSACSMQGRW